jgi:uncharacterized protein YfaS (alpha-2-macroglobulin family)
MSLRQIGPDTFVSLEEISAIQRDAKGNAIVFINGTQFPSEVPFEMLVDMVNIKEDSDEALEETKSQTIIPTTSAAQFAG